MAAVRTTRAILQRLAVPLVLWVVLLAVQGRTLLAIGVLIFGGWILEVVLAVAAIWTSLIALRPVLPRRLSQIAVMVAMLTLVAYLINWSPVHPESYFRVHRAEFAEIGRMVEAGDFEEPGDTSLPWWLVHLSANGDIQRQGGHDGAPMVMIEAFGAIDNAVGYVYFRGEPNDELVVDLSGRPIRLSNADYLGEGWWWADENSVGPTLIEGT